MRQLLTYILALTAVSLTSCGGGQVGQTSIAETPNASLGGTSFMHPEDIGDSDVSLAAALRRIHEEGPPEVTARFHSCRKLPYYTTGQILSVLGVNMAATGATTAGNMYKVSTSMLGAPNYGART